MDENTSPGNNQAELSILGSLILTGGKILDDLEFDPADYQQPVYETIHRTIAALKSAGQPIDPITVSSELNKTGQKIDTALLHRAVEATPTTSNASYYANIVTEAATARRLKTAAGKINELATTNGGTPEVIEEARKILDHAATSKTRTPVTFMDETIEETIDLLESEIQAIPTAWPQLNDLINGLQPGAVYVIGARPSVGKSVFAVQLAQAMLPHGSCAFISLEMNRNDLNLRFMSNELQIPMGRFMSRTLEDRDWKKIAPWIQNQQGRPLAVLDRSSSTITDIKRFIRSVHRRKPLAGIVVDYLQLMTQPNGDKRARHEFVSDMSRELKILAMDYNVPVVVLSQLNRNSTARTDGTPMLSDLRESGSIEQDADVVILLHRELHGEDSVDLKVGVAKNRRGRTGNFNLTFQGHYSNAHDEMSNK